MVKEGEKEVEEGAKWGGGKMGEEGAKGGGGDEMGEKEEICCMPVLGMSMLCPGTSRSKENRRLHTINSCFLHYCTSWHVH